MPSKPRPSSRTNPARSQRPGRSPGAPAAPPPAAGSTAARVAHAPVILTAAILAYAAVYSALCITKYRYYLYTDFDFAIFAQAMERLLHGSMFVSIRGMNWLGDHSSFVLFLLAPIYGALRHPVTLLVVQSISLGLGALPVFRLARRELGHDGAALGFAAAYLLYPAVGYTNLFEFHPETLATPALLFALDFLRAGRLVPTVAAAAFALLCREDVALVALPMGLYALLLRRPRRLRFALTLTGLAALSMVLTFAVLKPAFNQGEAGYADMYSRWGESLGQVAANLVKHPVAAVTQLFSTPGDPVDSALKGSYYLFMLAPLLALPLLSPVTLALALPVLLQHFLSWRMPQHRIVYQYTALVTPVFVVAGVIGAGNLLRWLGGGPPADPRASHLARNGRVAARSLTVALVGAAAACAILFGPLAPVHPFAGAVAPEPSFPNAYERTMKPYRDRMVAEAPREGGAVAGFEFLARFAGRANVHSAHHVLSGQFTFSQRLYPVPSGISAYLADLSEGTLLPAYVNEGTGARLRELVARNALAPVDAVGDLVLLARAPRDSIGLVRVGVADVERPARVVYDGSLAYLGADSVGARAPAGGVVAVRTCWARVARSDSLHLMVLALLDPSGGVVYRRVRHLGYAIYTVDAWPAGAPVTEEYRLPLPLSLAPGRYTLALTAAWAKGRRSGLSEPDDPAVRATAGYVALGTIEVAAAR